MDTVLTGAFLSKEDEVATMMQRNGGATVNIFIWRRHVGNL